MFNDVKRFMEASEQTTDFMNDTQMELYAEIVNEEMGEVSEAWADLNEALEAGDREAAEAHVEHLLKEVCDLVFAAIGFGFSAGLPVEEGMAEVVRSNLEKIVDGKVIKNPETGKVKKPEGWKDADNKALIAERIGKILKTAY